MNDTGRYLIAAVLIFLIIVLQPTYLKWLGYDTSAPPVSDILPESPEEAQPINDIVDNTPSRYPDAINLRGDEEESFLTIVSPLYTATISSRSGGSFVNYILNDGGAQTSKYIGGYDADGVFHSDLPVSIIMPSENPCAPCLAIYNDKSGLYNFINSSFILSNPTSYTDTVFLADTDSIHLKYILENNAGEPLLSKSLVLYANKYFSSHVFDLNNNLLDEYSNNFELMWFGGLRPTERKEDEDVQYGSGIINQAGEIEDINITDPDATISRELFKGKTEWSAIRTKYFMSAIVPNVSGSFATLSGKNISFGTRGHTPQYNASVGFPIDINFIASEIYLGPLDIDQIATSKADLDATMNWGYSIIKPISKAVLWVLKFMRNTLNLNYGFVLLIFAIIIRIITGPLTKKSYESSQNMQKLQPEIKKIQKKYKGDPQGLNKETMSLYKKHKVNPLGGCLPILLQMPLLWALFIVFRTTIEFRGAPFILWITDLSKPDVVLNLPFSIPIYGSGIAILPLIMGGTLLLTMKMSSATMDKSQKPIMYFMNVFFILLFNSFPSGLNLYYTAYNLLSYFQQRNIRRAVGQK